MVPEEANLDFDAASVSGPCGSTSFAGVEGEKRKDGLDSEEEAKSLTSNDSLEPQDIPNQAEAGQGPEAEPPGSAMDSPSHWQHNPVRANSPETKTPSLEIIHTIFDRLKLFPAQTHRSPFLHMIPMNFFHPNLHMPQSTNWLYPYSYNAKRRHWRKTRLGI